ncbi:MAG TPA: TonB-dependent receptor, partial [Sphingomicrobium sp.]
MIARLPGFTLDTGASVRGFAGAAGNVLIDGERPSTKADALDNILRRIPATSVIRIDIIRGGVPGIDMQGHTVLANVILLRTARTEMTATGINNAYSDGRIMPAGQLDFIRRSGDHDLSGSAQYYHEEGGEQGTGFQRITAGDGALIRDARGRKEDIDAGLKLRGAVQSPWLGGMLHLNASLDLTGTHQQEDHLFREPEDGRLSERIVDRFHRPGGEIGGDFTKQLGEVELNVVALQSLRKRTHDSTSNEDGVVSDLSTGYTAGESILRGTATYEPSRNLSLEGGGEGAYNFLNGHSSLSEDGVPVAIPNANARVQEKRGEAFLTATWRISSRWNLEATARAEASTISQQGDIASSESFFFPKPRLLLTWSPTDYFQMRTRFEREVSQLDFANFVATANLSSGVVSAGNAKLEPERRWVVETAFEKHFWKSADIVLTLRHQALEQVIDQVPVDGFNAPGNIGNGRRDTVQLDLTLPLERFGMAGGQLKGTGTWLHSQVRDPTTGELRPISDDLPFTGSVTLTNDVPRFNSTWTIALTSATRQTSFLIDEIDTELEAANLNFSWEYKPSPGLSVLAQLTNVTRHALERRQLIYQGLRSSLPLAET